MNMKKILSLALILALACGFAALAEGGKLVEPQAAPIDLEAPADGMYPSSFAPDAFADGKLTLTLYTEDVYDIVDVAQMEVGDSIVIAGETVLIESLGEDDTDKLINGGLDEGGYNLRPFEEDNCYKIVREDDYPTWTMRGEATLPLDEAVEFDDSWNIDGEPVHASGIDAVIAAIAESELDAFIEYNTIVTVESGKIVNITRVYMP